MRWAHDIAGYFTMCDDCAEYYQTYIVDDDEPDTESDE